MSILQNAVQRSTIVGEVFSFLWQRKLWWLMPLVILIFLIGLLLLLAQVSSVAPWMYSL